MVEAVESVGTYGKVRWLPSLSAALQVDIATGMSTDAVLHIATCTGIHIATCTGIHTVVGTEIHTAIYTDAELDNEAALDTAGCVHGPSS